MQHEEIQLKSFCEEIFDDYDIQDFKIDGDDIVMKVKKKKSFAPDIRKILNSILEARSELNIRTPSKI